MSTSSVHYYFPALGDLLLAVQREAVERFCVDREEAARREPDPRRRLLGMMRTGIPTGKDDTGFILVLELGMYARRDPAYAAQHIRLCERQIALYAAILEAGAASGVFELASDPMTIARGSVMLEDGIGLHMTQAVHTLNRAQAEQIMLVYASDATGCDLGEL